MANEVTYNIRNVGSEEAPVYAKWFAITIAEAVRMGIDDPTNIKEYVDSKIAALIGSAPAAYDTLQEIAAWITEHQDLYEALLTTVGNKVDKEDGKGLSENDFTDAYKSKLDTAAAADDLLYTNSTPTVQAHGGIAAGETFDAVPITEMLTKILYPWVAPVVSATITSPSNGGVKEKGDTQNVTAIRVNVTKKSSNITKVEIFDGASSLGSKTDGVANGGQFDFTVDVDVDTNKGFQAKVTDAAGKTTTANTGSFNFVYPYYYGTVANAAAANEATIKALTKQIVTKGNKTFSYNLNNNCACFAYPASYGNLKSIKDPNNFEVLGTFTKKTVQITGLDGTPQTYNVYVNEASTASGFAFTFAY